jgi:flavin reductase (DIM6/NTAB) family NADH-FMN oxidoreductase RutF
MVERGRPEDNLPSVGPQAFRSSFRRLAAGVALVTSKRHGRNCGLTATSFISVSIDPPLGLVSIDALADTASGIRETGAFGVSLLPIDQEETSRRFATSRLKTKFDGIRFREGITGVPLLEEAHACVECLLWDSHPAGDHILFIGRVVDVTVRTGTEPLVYHEGRYVGLSEETDGRFARVASAQPDGLLELLGEGMRGRGQ